MMQIDLVNGILASNLYFMHIMLCYVFDVMLLFRLNFQLGEWRVS